jgi:hypothetical protein
VNIIFDAPRPDAVFAPKTGLLTMLVFPRSGAVPGRAVRL